MRLTALPAALILLASCSREPADLPIDRNEMTPVLLAIYMAESRALILGEDVLEARIDALESFGYDTADFNRTMEGLANDPDYGKEVYEALIDSVVFAQRNMVAERQDSVLLDSLRLGGAELDRAGLGDDE